MSRTQLFVVKKQVPTNMVSYMQLEIKLSRPGDRAISTKLNQIYKDIKK